MHVYNFIFCLSCLLFTSSLPGLLVPSSTSPRSSSAANIDPMNELTPAATATSSFQRAYYIFDDRQLLSDFVINFILKTAEEAIQKKGYFSIALSGGSMPQVVCQIVNASEKSMIDWPKWIILFADERIVPLDHEDSNYYMYKACLFDKISIPSENIIILEDLDDPVRAADLYTSRILQKVENGEIDLVMLGVGPDGHIASLFPDHRLLNSDRLVDSIEDSPKLPLRRITLTLKSINASKNVLFVVTGSSKATIVGEIISSRDSNQGLLPPSFVKPKELLIWVLDQEAAAKIDPRDNQTMCFTVSKTSSSE